MADLLEVSDLGTWFYTRQGIVKAVDGVSLTVVQPLDDGFTVAIIPHTSAVTTLGVRKPGDRVNIEVDVMAKYVERLINAHLEAAR